MDHFGPKTLDELLSFSLILFLHFKEVPDHFHDDSNGVRLGVREGLSFQIIELFAEMFLATLRQLLQTLIGCKDEVLHFVEILYYLEELVLLLEGSKNVHSFQKHF